MPLYTVELEAQIPVRYSLQVEAADEDEAKRKDEANAPVMASFWDVMDGQVSGIEAVDAVAEED